MPYQCPTYWPQEQADVVPVIGGGYVLRRPHCDAERCILPGFWSNLASIDRFGTLLSGLTPDGLHRTPALIHDFEYEMGAASGKTRRQVDKEFRTNLVLAGHSKETAQMMYVAVRSQGWRYWNGPPPKPRKRRRPPHRQ